MKKQLFCTIITLFLVNMTFAQQFSVTGKVTDRQTAEKLSFATVRVLNSAQGTSTNKAGEYELRLKKGNYRLSVSFLGYHTDTVKVEVNGAVSGVDFKLLPTNVNLPEVTVLPGVNPAIEVIRKAIEAKKNRNKLLNSYQFEAYTKGVVKTPEDLRVTGHNASTGFSKITDSTKLKITGILENQSRGYFKKPNKYKDVVIARKQSANFPPSLNIITGGRFIDNFYEERIDFINGPLPGPLADDALDYYYFTMDDTLAIDNTNVFKISITPDKENNPGFTGKIYITDGSFNLLKVELQINRAANTGGLIDSVFVEQQFAPFDDNIYMPVDYRLLLNVTILKLAKFALEMNTILHNYEVNNNIDDSFFDKAIVTVLPEADKKDSVYWTKIQAIHSTVEENTAYARIDSIEKAPRTFWDDFSFLGNRFSITKNLSATAPLGLYHYNMVEGHALDYGFYLSNALDTRLNGNITGSYGFADKKFKKQIDASYLLGDYRTFRVSGSAFDRVNVLFGESDVYSEFTNTILALFTKYEYRDYYYSKGFSLGVRGDVFPVLSMGLSFVNATDKNGYNNSDFSFFNKKKKFRTNWPVYETRLNTLSARFNFDFRDYIEDGLYRRKVSLGKSYFTFGGEVMVSDKDALGSGMDFTIYKANAYAYIRTFKSAFASLRIKGGYSDGPVPFQMLYALPGNLNSVSSGSSFRTLDVKEIIGDRYVTVHFDHNFMSELYRLSGIPYLKSSEFTLSMFFNAAYSEISSKSREILPAGVKSFPHPFYEAGFSIGHVLSPLALEFGWRLNYKNGNNFTVNLNSAIF
jgi:hypothetical protein